MLSVAGHYYYKPGRPHLLYPFSLSRFLAPHRTLLTALSSRKVRAREKAEQTSEAQRQQPLRPVP